jgi:NADPH:quinone reductase-like Zn-dependent oxidoreductase
MKAISYSQTGDPDVLHGTERPVPEPGPDEVRVRVHVSGVNPTDWKSRRGSAPGQPAPFPEVVPNQVGAGTVDAVGAGVDERWVGQRVWWWEAAWQRADGTAQEYVVLPQAHAVPLPEGASFDVGAAIRAVAPECVNIVAEVAPAANAALDTAVIAADATIAVYANNGGDELVLPVRANMTPNSRYQFVFLYTVPAAAKRRAVEDVLAALAAGALSAGEAAGPPLHRIPLDRTAQAHAAVEAGTTGKVLIDIS